MAQCKPHKRLFSAPAHRLGEFGQSHPVVWNTFFLGLVLTRPKEALAYDAAPPLRAGPLGIGDLKKALKQGLGCFSYGGGAWLSLLRANTGTAGGRERGQAGPILSHKYSQISIPREKHALLVNGVDFIILLYCLWPISRKWERKGPARLVRFTTVGGSHLGTEGLFAFPSDFRPTRTAKGPSVPLQILVMSLLPSQHVWSTSFFKSSAGMCRVLPLCGVFSL